MHFDIVIGNPNYNNDMYVDFVLLSKQLINNNTNSKICMITPAKWQAKSGDNNEEFRQTIVPYISDIVLYQDASDIFDIAEPDGVCYYLITNSNHKIKNITNISYKQQLFNNFEQREIENSINNTFNKIINKVKSKTNNFLKVSTDRAYWLRAKTELEDNISYNSVAVYGTDQNGKKMLYGYYNKEKLTKHIEEIDKYKVILHFKQGNGFFTLDSNGQTYGLKKAFILNPGEICKDDFMCIFTTDILDEALIFQSYLTTKLVRFLAYCGCTGVNSSNQETWRFVPSPSNFNKNITNEQLYKDFEFTAEEIKIIESVIK